MRMFETIDPDVTEKCRLVSDSATLRCVCRASTATDLVSCLSADFVFVSWHVVTIVGNYS
jgi:hypothetical protein